MEEEEKREGGEGRVVREGRVGRIAVAVRVEGVGAGVGGILLLRSNKSITTG